MSEERAEAAEFSFVIDLDALPRGGKHFKLAANADERARIAKRLGVPAVEKLEGDVRLSANARTIEAEGEIRAALTRVCVSSLEEMPETVEEAFEARFVRDEAASIKEPDDETWETPEYHEGRDFDVGDLLTQQLALAMAPFPRKEGAASLAEQYGAAQHDSPFAILKEKIEKSE